MKNLKKVLSLVLALAMALSLMTAAFAADANDFADYDKVEYNEAVDVMVAAGVFNGVAGNNFAPNDTLTREQAAKIVTYMLVGQTQADKLVTTIAPYADVAANRWSAGSIAYCTNEGILAGTGGNKFNPTGKLSGLEFAKMLLVALGYDAQIEKLEGSAWAINTAKLASTAKLDDGLKIAMSATLTREQAAQMAFNAFKADMVDYDNRGTEVKLPDGSSVIVNASKAETMAQGNYDNNLKATGLQFAEKYCEDLKKIETTDDFGRPSTQWKLKTDEIGNYADKADASYTKDVKLGDIYADLGLSIRTVPTIMEDGKDLKNTDKVLFKGNSTKVGAKGVLTEAYVDDDDNVTLVQINTYVGQVNRSVAATSSRDAYVVIRPASEKPDGVKGDMNYETTASFDDDAYVLYTYANNEVQSVAVAESVSGEVTTYTEGKNITVGGTKYDYSAKKVTPSSISTKNDYVVYLDAYGYAIYVDEEEFVSSDYAFVLKAQNDDGSWDTQNRAELIFTDGTTKTVPTKDGYNSYENEFVTYKINDNNEYVLRAVSTTKPIEKSANFKLTKGTAAITYNDGSAKTLYANSNTVFIVATKDNHGDTIYKAYTGIANAPSVTAESGKTVTVAYYQKANSSIVTMMYIDATSGASVSTSSKDVTFLAGKSVSGKITNADNDEYYTYNAVVNGEITTVKVDAGKDMDVSNIMTDGKLISGVINALFGNVTYSDDIITGLTAYNADATKNPYTASATGTVKVSGDNTLGFGKDSSIAYFTAAKDCKVFYADADGVITEGSVSGIATDEDDRAYYVVDDGELTYVFIQSYEKNAEDPGASQSANYTAKLTKNNGTVTLTVTSNKDAAEDVKGTVKMSGSVNMTTDLTGGKTTGSGNNWTYTEVIATNSANTVSYQVTVEIGGETLNTNTIVGG